MSKPISFGFGKSKTATNPRPATNGAKTTISLGSVIKKVAPRKAALDHDDEDAHDDEQPQAEALTGFSSSGAILSAPVEEKKHLVIENTGNNWRKFAGRQKSGLPAEVQAVREGKSAVTIEKDEVSKASGLQLADAVVEERPRNEQVQSVKEDVAERKESSADDEALQALLAGDESKANGTAVIEAEQDDRHNNLNDRDDFQAFVESHPDSSTLDEYAAMPVEEFGMAMLRGMGKKRRANGEVIQLEPDTKKDEKRVKRQEFLGIGAKAAAGLDGVELGAWGKADMRKNNKGAGFFTPLMVRDSKTGETITEEELERRKTEAKSSKHDLRDTDSERKGREDHHGYRDAMHDFSRRDKDNNSDRSRRHRDEDRDYDSFKSRRKTSRSRSKDRHKRSRDDDKYDSTSSRHDRDKYRDSESGRHRDRRKEREGYSVRRSEDYRSRRH